MSIQLWLSTELSGKIGTLTLLALFVFFVEMGFIGTLLDLMKSAMLRLLLVVSVLLLLGIPIFPVCQEWAKEQFCLCCTIFLKVRFILGPQGCLAGGRACR